MWMSRNCSSVKTKRTAIKQILSEENIIKTLIFNHKCCIIFLLVWLYFYWKVFIVFVRHFCDCMSLLKCFNTIFLLFNIHFNLLILKKTIKQLRIFEVTSLIQELSWKMKYKETTRRKHSSSCFTIPSKFFSYSFLTFIHFFSFNQIRYGKGTLRHLW